MSVPPVESECTTGQNSDNWKLELVKRHFGVMLEREGDGGGEKRVDEVSGDGGDIAEEKVEEERVFKIVEVDDTTEDNDAHNDVNASDKIKSVNADGSGEWIEKEQDVSTVSVIWNDCFKVENKADDHQNQDEDVLMKAGYVQNTKEIENKVETVIFGDHNNVVTVEDVAPDIPGPKVWLDLNRKCETQIIAFFNKNEERSSWMKPYLEECKKKLGVACPDPTFVPKTPSQPKRGGRRMKASIDGKESAKSGDVSNNSSRSTRATRGSERNATQEFDTTTVSTVDATTSCTPPAMKEATSALEESEEVFSIEPVIIATYSGQDDKSSAVTADATFEVEENDVVPEDIFIVEQFVQAEDVAKPAEEDEARPIRSTRSKPKQLSQSCSEIALTKGADSPKARETVAPTVSNNATFENENDYVPQDISTEEQSVEDIAKPAEDEEARPVRSTRSKPKQLAQLCSEIVLTKGAELAAQVLTPTLKQSTSSSAVGYTGSPVKDGVKVKQGMRDSAGLGAKRTDKENTPMKQAHYSKRRSSIRDCCCC